MGGKAKSASRLSLTAEKAVIEMGWLQPISKHCGPSLIALKFFGRFADNSIKRTRFCDVRIESILLDVNENVSTGS